MLVLKRGYREEIVIEHAGERLVITVLEMDGHYARLGFAASCSFRIARRELIGAGGEFPDGFRHHDE